MNCMGKWQYIKIGINKAYKEKIMQPDQNESVWNVCALALSADNGCNSSFGQEW